MPASALRVAICEGEYLLALDLAHQLEAEGIDVVGMFLQPAELSASLTTLLFDAAIVDLGAEDVAALVLTQALVEAGRHVVLTGTQPHAQLPDVIGHLEYHAKPASFLRIRDSLASALAARGADHND